MPSPAEYELRLSPSSVSVIQKALRKDIDSLAQHLIDRITADPKLIGTRWHTGHTRQLQKLRKALEEIGNGAKEFREAVNSGSVQHRRD